LKEETAHAKKGSAAQELEMYKALMEKKMREKEEEIADVRRESRLQTAGGAPVGVDERKMKKMERTLLERDAEINRLKAAESDPATQAGELKQSERIIQQGEREIARLQREVNALKAQLASLGVEPESKSAAAAPSTMSFSEPTSSSTTQPHSEAQEVQRASFSLDRYISLSRPKAEPSPVRKSTEPAAPKTLLSMPSVTHDKVTTSNMQDLESRIAKNDLRDPDAQYKSKASGKGSASLEAKAAAFFSSSPSTSSREPRNEASREQSYRPSSSSRTTKDNAPGYRSEYKTDSPSYRGSLDSGRPSLSERRPASPGYAASERTRWSADRESASVQSSPHGNPAPARAPSFEALDRNSDGVISRAEWNKSSMSSGWQKQQPQSGWQKQQPQREVRMAASPVTSRSAQPESLNALAASLAELTAANQGALQVMNQQMSKQKDRYSRRSAKF